MEQQTVHYRADDLNLMTFRERVRIVSIAFAVSLIGLAATAAVILACPEGW